MPVTVSYPGLYLEEIPSNARSIVAAPTSIAVFIGYSHPFKTVAPGVPVRLFSFSDYERYFGGIFRSGAIDTNLGYAVYQFFLNGGSDAYVVGIQPTTYQRAGGATANITAATADHPTAGGAIRFTAKEPTDMVETTLTILIGNIRSSAGPGGTLDTADYTFVYGTRIESYRAVKLTSDDFDKVTAASSLVSIAPVVSYGTNFNAPPSNAPISLTLSAPPPVDVVGTFKSSDFTDTFKADGPLDKVDIFNLLLLPGISDNGVLSTALAFAERKQAFMIMDPPANAVASSTVDAEDMTKIIHSGDIPVSQNGAIFFPYLKSSSPVSGEPVDLPPSGFVAGIFARTDTRRGVWKAPAGLEALVNNTTGVVESGRMNDQRQGVLNLAAVNCLRSFPGVGTVVFGSRTLVSENPSFQQYKYIPVRRMTLFIEQTLLANLKWVVFEPNDEPLWLAIRNTIENFMLSLFNQQALQGSKPSDAFQVKCDRTTTTPDDQQTGKVNIVVAFAPLKPAEFVIIKIAHLAGQTQA